MLFELLGQFLSVFRGVQQQEGCAETGGEGRLRGHDAALGAGQLGGVAAQVVVHGLLLVEDGDGRQHAESVGREEDDLARVRAAGNRTHDVVDVVNRVGDTGVLGLLGGVEVDIAFRIHNEVLQQRIATDGVEDVGLFLLTEVDALRVAAALEVEDAVVVPAVLVVADEGAVRVGGEGRRRRSCLRWRSSA